MEINKMQKNLVRENWSQKEKGKYGNRRDMVPITCLQWVAMQQNKEWMGKKGNSMILRLQRVGISALLVTVY